MSIEKFKKYLRDRIKEIEKNCENCNSKNLICECEENNLSCENEFELSILYKLENIIKNG